LLAGDGCETQPPWHDCRKRSHYKSACAPLSFAIPHRLRPMGFAMDVSRSQWRIRRPSLRRNPCVSEFRREYLLRPILQQPILTMLGPCPTHRSASRATTYDELIEMNFGDWQGLGWDAISREQLDAWAADLWNYRPGGGNGRLRELRKSDPQCVIAVTHAGVIRVALARSGKAREATAVAKSIPFGSIHQLT
jgi:hypothetical protein